MKKEIRQITDSNIKTDPEKRQVEGYAVVFESESENLGFYETIHRNAITDETIKNSDVLCKFNHDDQKVLARSKNGEGSLKLNLDERGLKYSFEAPNTASGNELLEYIKRGDLKSSSFAFTIPDEEGAEKWTKRDGKIYRDIYKINRLYDVSPVFQPAYSETTCSTRFKEIVETSKEIDSIMDLNKKEIENL